MQRYRQRTILGAEDGQGTVEYALVIGAVSAAIIVILSTAAIGWMNTITSATTEAIGALLG